jgi:O-antigen chain-terminating methyltransferase
MPPENRADLAALSGFHDSDFVIGAFRKILDRDPDPVGYEYYLKRVRLGASKSSVIGDLASSREGRRNIKISGLWRYRVMVILARIPVLGRLVEAVVFLCRVREFTADIRKLENHLYRLTVEIERVDENYSSFRQ